MPPDFDLIDEAFPHDLEIAHEDLVNAIVEEEEQLLVGHRRNVDQRIEMLRIEMSLLNDPDRGGVASSEQYAIQLTELCRRGRKLYEDLESDLSQFIGHLKEEDVLSLAITPGNH
jgi:hypothetical protein